MLHISPVHLPLSSVVSSLLYKSCWFFFSDSLQVCLTSLSFLYSFLMHFCFFYPCLFCATGLKGRRQVQGSPLNSDTDICSMLSCNTPFVTNIVPMPSWHPLIGILLWIIQILWSGINHIEDHVQSHNPDIIITYLPLFKQLISCFKSSYLERTCPANLL